MSLVAVAWPISEPERAAMVSLLEANGIPCFVHGGNFASALPGLQIGAYNMPTIMVPACSRQEALELLSVFSRPSDSPANAPLPVGFWAKVRVILEAAIFGWAVAPPPQHEDHRDEAGAGPPQEGPWRQ